MNKQNGVYVQYGCGLSAPDEWMNFDVSPTLRLQKLPIVGAIIRNSVSVKFPKNVLYGDIRKGLPVADNSCEAVYCSHTLEHLALEDFRVALKNTYRILKPGGVFRCVVPDLEYIARKYVNALDKQNPTASIQFIGGDSLLGVERRPKGFFQNIKSLYGNSNHLWMWDFYSLSEELSKVGFKNSRKAKFNDSEVEHFKFVESEERFINALAIQCYK